MPQSVIGLKSWIWANNAKSTFLLAMFPALLAILFFIGAYLVIWGSVAPSGVFYQPEILRAALDMTVQTLPYILGGAAIWVLLATFFNTWMINAATGARSVTRAEEPELYNLLENLCISRGLPMPRLQVMEDAALNAFASGLDKDSFSITVTRGLMQTLNRDEMESVLGHELTHIMNRDVRLLVVTTVFVGMISFLSQMAWRNMMGPIYISPSYDSDNRNRRSNLPVMLIASALLVIGYVLALLLRFAISRKREYVADAGSVELTKNPAALASALRKISGQSTVSHVPPEVRQMFIENEPGMLSGLFGLFATHPPVEKRIALLEDLAGEGRETDRTPSSSVPPASAL